jgi:hypothetical protein
MESGVFKLIDLVLIAGPEAYQDPREPPLAVGDCVQLNSGGAVLLVVAVDGDNLTVAWRDQAGETHERTYPRVCFHRARD